MSNLDAEERIVYQCIKASGSKGIPSVTSRRYIFLHAILFRNMDKRYQDEDEFTPKCAD